MGFGPRARGEWVGVEKRVGLGGVLSQPCSKAEGVGRLSSPCLVSSTVARAEVSADIFTTEFGRRGPSSVVLGSAILLALL